MALIPTTYLELTAPPAGEPLAPPMPSASVALERLSAALYLALFKAVGDPLGWDGRTTIAPRALAEMLAAPTTHLFVLRFEAAICGFCEFDHYAPSEAELVYFGLVPRVQGKGLGPYLLDAAVRGYWAMRKPRRIWLHTDTWDDPKAISIYRRAGFTIFAEHKLSETATYEDYKAAIGLKA